jgi:hypothetical protein
MEPSDYYDTPINTVLHFIRSVELIKCYPKGKQNRPLKVAVQGPDYYGPPLMHSLTHSFIHLTVALDTSYVADLVTDAPAERAARICPLFKIRQVSHFPILSHGLSLITITSSLTRALQCKQTEEHSVLPTEVLSM